MTIAPRAEITRAASVIGGADLIGRMLLFVTVAIAAWALTPAELGRYVVSLAVALVVAGLWDMGLSQLLLREIAAGRVELRSAVRRAMTLRLKSAGLWLVAIVPTLMATDLFFNPLSLWIVAISLTVSVQQLLLSSLRAKLEFRKFSAALTWGRAVTLLLVFGVFIFPHAALPVLVIGYLCGEVATFALAAFWIRPYWHSDGPVAEANAQRAITFRRSAPLATNIFLGLAYNRLDIVLVSLLVSPTQLGFYAIASRMQDALAIVPRTISNVLLPMMSSSSSSPAAVRALIREGLIFGLALAVLALLAVAVAGPLILKIIPGWAMYRGALTPVRILSISVLFMAASAPFLAALVATNRAGSTVPVYGAAFAVSMLLLPILASRWGATGAAIAALSREPGALVLSIGLSAWYGLLPGRSSSDERDSNPEQVEGEESQPHVPLPGKKSSSITSQPGQRAEMSDPEKEQDLEQAA